MANWEAELTDALRGQRVFPDVYVLLSAIFADGSDSQRVLNSTSEATVVLSEHVQETATVVLRLNAPHLLGVLGDTLIRLSQRTNVDRVGPGAPDCLPSWAKSLDREDRQVLADAIHSKADLLLTQDADFFGGPVPGLRVETPSSLVSPLRALDPEYSRFGRESWTFLSWFYPSWGTKLVHGTRDLFYIFEVAEYIACFYETERDSFTLRWRTPAGARGTLRLPYVVEPHKYHFASVAVRADHLMLFMNGETRAKRVSLGPLPLRTNFHPFMSAESKHQIAGGVRYRVVPTALSERWIRKHWRARSLSLTDREVELHEMIGPVLGLPNDDGQGLR